MFVVTTTQARAIVSLYGAWPQESCLVIPDPPMMFYILPSMLEWARN